MINVLKKTSAVILCAFILIACVACSLDEKSKVDRNAGKADITSTWTFDHAVNKGKNVPRLATDKDEDPNIPHFSSDGKTFTFNIRAKNTYKGTVTDNGDGTYTLTYREDKPKVKAVIEGNSLTIVVSENSSVVFVVKK